MRYNDYMKNKSIIFTLISSILWATIATVIKLMGDGLNNFQILFFSSGISFIFLIILSLATGKLSIIKKLKLKDYVMMASIGFIGIFLCATMLYTAIQQTSGQEVFLIYYTWPIWTLIIVSVMTKKKITKQIIFSMLLSFFGASLIMINYKNLANFSIVAGILAILSAVCYGVFSALIKKFDYDATVANSFYYLFTFIFTAIYILSKNQFVMPTINQVFGLLWLGIMTNGAGYICWQAALKKGRISQVTNLILITPFLSIMFLAIVFRQPISILTILGGILVISGILLSRRKI